MLNRLILFIFTVLILTVSGCGPTHSPVGATSACRDSDINNDGAVDRQDLHLLEVAFASRPADLNWDSRADLVRDERIDGKDAFSIIECF